MRDARDLELDGVTTRTPAADAPVIRLERCPGAVVRNCRAGAGTGTFLSVPPGELRDLALVGDALAAAREPAAETAAEPAPVTP